jgi:peroxiredoxin
MKVIHWNTLAGLTIAVAGALLIFSGHTFIAGGVLALAYWVVVPDVPKFTSWFNILSGTLVAFFLGFAFDHGSGHFPFITCATLLITCAIMLRLVFYRQMLHTRLLWVDALFLLGGFACYVTGNLMYPQGWAQWVLPILPSPLSLMLVAGFIREGRAYKAMDQQSGADVGTMAPLFTLPDQDGNEVSLEGFRDRRDVLLIFVRGDWCPACHIMLRTYERNRHKFQERNVMLLAIGPDKQGVNRQMATNLGIEFRILADETHETAKRYRSYVSNDPVKSPLRTKYEDGGLPLPASFLVDKQGIIRYGSRADDAGELLDPSMIFDVLDKISG